MTTSPLAFYRWTELDRASWPAFRDAAGSFEGVDVRPRRHPGERAALPKPAARRLAALDRALLARRSARKLPETPLPDRELAHLLYFAHGAVDGPRGPVPSAGGLQALELYVVRFGDGAYHYDRAEHRLTRVASTADRAAWREWVPSLDTVEGGALLWVIAGDVERVEPKYGARGLRFLLLEAGHLMQNLCLLSASLKRTTVPLGAFFEKDVARALALPASDLVLYAGLC